MRKCLFFMVLIVVLSACSKKEPEVETAQVPDVIGSWENRSNDFLISVKEDVEIVNSYHGNWEGTVEIDNNTIDAENINLFRNNVGGGFCFKMDDQWLELRDIDFFYGNQSFNFDVFKGVHEFNLDKGIFKLVGTFNDSVNVLDVNIELNAPKLKLIKGKEYVFSDKLKLKGSIYKLKLENGGNANGACFVGDEILGFEGSWKFQGELFHLVFSAFYGNWDEKYALEKKQDTLMLTCEREYDSYDFYGVIEESNLEYLKCRRIFVSNEE